jgi:hypothetical protein
MPKTSTLWNLQSSLKKNQRNQHQIQDFINKTIYFFGALSFSPCVVFDTWLHPKAPQKFQEK